MFLPVLDQDDWNTTSAFGDLTGPLLEADHKLGLSGRAAAGSAVGCIPATTSALRLPRLAASSISSASVPDAGSESTPHAAWTSTLAAASATDGHLGTVRRHPASTAPRSPALRGTHA